MSCPSQQDIDCSEVLSFQHKGTENKKIGRPQKTFSFWWHPPLYWSFGPKPVVYWCCTGFSGLTVTNAQCPAAQCCHTQPASSFPVWTLLISLLSLRSSWCAVHTVGNEWVEKSSQMKARPGRGSLVDWEGLCLTALLDFLSCGEKCFIFNRWWLHSYSQGRN